MAISSILGGSFGAASSAVGSAAKSGGSSFAEFLERARGAASAETNSATTGTTLAEATRDAENQFSEFKRSIEQLFAAAGIDTGFPIELRADGLGGIEVNGDHPDHEQIEKLLRSNPDLIEKFNKLQSAFEQVKSGSEQDDKGKPVPTFLVKFDGADASVGFED